MRVRAWMAATWVAVALPVAAQQSQPGFSRPLTLDDCLARGLRQSLEIARIREDKEIAESRADQARADALPHFTANAEYTRLDELQEVALGDQTIELGTLDNYNMNVGVSQTLYSGGRVRAALRAARLNREYADQDGSEREAALVRDIHLAFYAVLLGKEHVGVRRASIAEAEALVKQTKSRLDSGTVPELDYLSAQVRLSNEQPLLIQSLGGLDLARENLRRLIQYEGEELDVAGNLQHRKVDASPARYIDLALRQRPRLQALRTVVGLRKEDVINARADRRPQLSANALVTGANSYGFVGFQDDWEWHWNAGLVLSWKIWDGGLTSGTVREKEHAERESALMLRDVEDQVELEVRQICVELRSAQGRVTAGAGGVALGERALTQAQTRYDAGVATTLDVISASQALAQARLNYQSAMKDHMAAVARLAFACGVSVEQLLDGEGPLKGIVEGESQ